jgi:hypothetical protein
MIQQYLQFGQFLLLLEISDNLDNTSFERAIKYKNRTANTVQISTRLWR